MTRLVLLALAATAATEAPARGELIVEVTAALGPNVFNSPSYNAYRDNALAALWAGAPASGTPGTPSHYRALPNGGGVAPGDIVVTGFPSWGGRADPAAPFAAESGTRLYFGLVIRPAPGSTARQFSISELAFSGTTTDPQGVLDFGFPAGGYEYDDDYVGLLLNPDGSVRERVTMGLNTQLVDALVGRGSTNAFEVLAQPGLTDQEAIDRFLTGRAPFTFTGTYTLGGTTGSATVEVAAGLPVPAPAGWITAALLTTGMAARRRR